MFTVRMAEVKKSFGKAYVLRGINFLFEGSEQCVIRGASGSGKSTLLHLLGGLEQVSSGEIWVDDLKLNALSDKDHFIRFSGTLCIPIRNAVFKSTIIYFAYHIMEGLISKYHGSKQ